MIGQNIDVDRLISEIDQQIEILNAIAGDNLILTEQLRLLLEARELIVNQELEIGRLAELIDPDQEDERLTIIDRESLRNQSDS